MSGKPTKPEPSLDQQIQIAASTEAVLEAFFDAHAVASWWQAVRSVTIPRPLGIYAVEWDATPFRDEILGHLGGTFYGTVMDYRPDGGFFLAEAYWLPPDGDPVGPMAFEVSVTRSGDTSTTIRVRQTGYEESPRWRRYYEIVNDGWKAALEALKAYTEQDLAERLWGKWGRLTAAERAAADEARAMGAPTTDPPRPDASSKPSRPSS